MNISTDDLLKQATPRPWHVGGIPSGGRGSIIYAKDGYAIADTKTFHARHMAENKTELHETHAELITRAVNSFEAMRECLQQVRGDIQAVKEAMSTPDAWDRCETLLGTSQAYIDRMLALAEGKAVQSKPKIDRYFGCSQCSGDLNRDEVGDLHCPACGLTFAEESEVQS